jgi:hypothetical protein
MKRTREPLLKAAKRLDITILDCHTIDEPMLGWSKGKTLSLSFRVAGVDRPVFYICPSATPTKTSPSYFVNALRNAIDTARAYRPERDAGTVRVTSVEHDPGCPMANGKGSCTCDPVFRNGHYPNDN